jgi:hypothetical protein
LIFYNFNFFNKMNDQNWLKNQIRQTFSDEGTTFFSFTYIVKK